MNCKELAAPAMRHPWKILGKKHFPAMLSKDQTASPGAAHCPAKGVSGVAVCHRHIGK
jgi:hypothetical protein